jgi:purine nucleoside permease
MTKFLFAILFLTLPAAAPATDLITPKVMVVTTYETGKDRGDTPGELQYWVERENLDQSIQVPGIDHPILTNGKGLYAMICGTTSRCAIQMMTLAMDPRFDLRKTYFLLSGIAGVDPHAASLGSAAWVKQAVDGDPTFEIDSRETPASWPYGTVALGTDGPGKVPANVDSTPAAAVSDNGSGGVGKVVFTLNPSLADWAYGLTKNVVIPDTPGMAASRARYKDYPMAQKPPFVLEGGSLGADHYWSGAIMAHWGEDWVRLYTRGQSQLVMSDCEDQGLCLAMEELTRLGHVDFQRLLILRSGSDYVLPPPGVTPAQMVFDDLSGAPGYLPALDSDYRVGSVVVAALLKDWPKYRDQVP